MWPHLKLKWPQVDRKSTWANSNDLNWLELTQHVTWVDFKGSRIVFSISLFAPTTTWSPRDWTLLQQVRVCCHRFLFHHLETDKLEPFLCCHFILYWSLFIKCGVRICPCVKQENQIYLVAQKGLPVNLWWFRLFWQPGIGLLYWLLHHYLYCLFFLCTINFFFFFFVFVFFFFFFFFFSVYFLN